MSNKKCRLTFYVFIFLVIFTTFYKGIDLKHWNFFLNWSFVLQSLRSTVLKHSSIHVALLFNNHQTFLTIYQTNKLHIFVQSRTSKPFTIFPKSVLFHISPQHAPFPLIIKMNYLLFPKDMLRLCLCCFLYLKCPSSVISILFFKTQQSQVFCSRNSSSCATELCDGNAPGSQNTILSSKKIPPTKIL